MSAEFRQKYTFYELALVERGSVYVYAEHNSYEPLDEYGGMLKDLVHQVRENPDGSLTYTFEVPPQYVEAADGELFDVVMTYYPSDETEPEPSSRSNRLYARAHIDVVQDAQPTRGTYTSVNPLSMTRGRIRRCGLRDAMSSCGLGNWFLMILRSSLSMRLTLRRERWWVSLCSLSGMTTRTTGLTPGGSAITISVRS